MGFDHFLGNVQLKQNLLQSLDKGHISHFYLISGPKGSGKHTLARLLAAAILCRQAEKPCMNCSICRRCLEQAHPDFITVEDPDHKRIPVDMVRRIREDMFILPNESDHKIYLFPQELGIEGQNALLKVLEEPPSYGVFILLTENSEKILPTVRSRCRELKLQALPSDLLRSALLREFPKADPADLDAAILRSGGYLGQAKQFLQEGAALPKEAQALLQAFAARDSLALVQTLAPMEKWKRDALTDTLSTSLELMESALALGMGGISATTAARELANRCGSQDIYSAIIALKKALVYLQGNISPAAVCGWLTWQLR